MGFDCTGGCLEPVPGDAAGAAGEAAVCLRQCEGPGGEGGWSRGTGASGSRFPHSGSPARVSVRSSQVGGLTKEKKVHRPFPVSR